MRQFNSLLVLAISLLLASCSMFEQQEQSPMLVAGNFLVFTPGDTIPHDTLRVSSPQGDFVLDTLSMTDSVRFVLMLGGYYNSLTTFSASWDSTRVRMSYDLSKVLEAIDGNSEQLVSRPGELVLPFKSGYNYVSFPVSYVPVASSTPSAFDVQMTLRSDAKQYNNATLKFIQPLK